VEKVRKAYTLIERMPPLTNDFVNFVALNAPFGVNSYWILIKTSTSNCPNEFFNTRANLKA